VDTLPEILATRSAEVAEAVTSAVASHIVPSSAWLRAEHRRHEREAVRTHMVERVLGLAATGEPLSDDDLRFYEGLGALFARHGVPLRVLTAAFDIGTAAITEESWRLAPAGHFAEMAQFTGAAARLMEQAQQASIRAYLEVGQAGRDPRPVRWVLAEAVIAGEPALAAAHAARERLAPGYLVMACAASPVAQADALHRPAVGKAVESVPGTLYCADRARLVVLLPVEAPSRRAQAAATAAELAERLRSVTGQPACAAQAYRPGLAQVPASLSEAHSTLSLAMAIPDTDRRLYRADDLLVELAIFRQPDIRQRLADLLSPLEAGTDLRHTLTILLACNLDRERAARELCIHRRTLRYRIDRIRDLSGIDPDSVGGLQVLRAALTATRLPDLEPPAPRQPAASVSVH